MPVTLDDLQHAITYCMLRNDSVSHVEIKDETHLDGADKHMLLSIRAKRHKEQVTAIVYYAVFPDGSLYIPKTSMVIKTELLGSVLEPDPTIDEVLGALYQE